MKATRRSLALLLAAVFLLMPLQSVMAGSRFKYNNYEYLEPIRKRSEADYYRTAANGLHGRDVAWTALHWDTDRQTYYSILCVAPQPAEVGVTSYEVVLGPALMGHPSLERINYQRPTVPPPPGPLESEDRQDPMWIRWREIEGAISALGGAPNPLATTTSSREIHTVTISHNNGRYFSHDFNEGGWYLAADAGYGKNCAVLSIGSGTPQGPYDYRIGYDTSGPNMWIDDAKRERAREALRVYPPIQFTVPGYEDGMPEHRLVMHAVAHFAVEKKVTLQADTTAVETGVPISLYLKVEHDAKAVNCPVDIGISLPYWFTVKDAQGGEEESGSLSENDYNAYRNLWWRTQLEPGRVFERWITVIPGTPPDPMPVWAPNVEFWGGLYIEPWALPKPDNVKLELPLASEEHPASVVALPEKRNPADDLKDGICSAGVATATPAPERIKLEANPPLLRSQDGYKTTITARLVDLPGKPAAKGVPITLEANSGATLTNVRTQGTVTTATLSIDPQKALDDSDVLVTAKSADGYGNILIVPVGGLWLMGQVLLRPGDGSESPVDGARVTAREVDGSNVYTGTTESNGWYQIRIKEGKKLAVSVDALGYLPAQLEKPTDPPGKDDAVKAPPIYLVKRDTLEHARRKVAQIQTYQKGLAMGDSLLTKALNWQATVPDPTTPGGKLEQWLQKVANEKSSPPHREEALRRLNLALETAEIAGRDAKTYADEFATAAWDDGVGAALDLLKAVQGMGDMLGKKAAETPDADHQRLLEQQLSIDFKPKRQALEDKFHGMLMGIFRKIDDVQGLGLVGGERSDELINFIIAIITDWSSKTVNQAWQTDDPGQKLLIDTMTGKLPDGIAREIKEVISDAVALAYLETVNAELTAALDRAAQGHPGGFQEGYYQLAQIDVRQRTVTLNHTRNGVGNTPTDVLIKEFVEGSLKDLQGWGYLAITAVTAGQAAAALEKIDFALDIGNALLKGKRFLAGLDMLNQTLSVRSDWWKAMTGGIQASMGAGDPGAAVAPAKPSVTIKPGMAAMMVAGESKAIDAAPFVAEGRTMVPVRAAAEALGAEPKWNGTTQQVTLTRDGHSVVMTIGKPEATVDGMARLIDPNNPAVVPVLKDGRTFVPIRFLADALGAELTWDQATESITLSIP